MGLIYRNIKTNISLLIQQAINAGDCFSQEFRFSREEQKLLCKYFKPSEIKKNEFTIKMRDYEKYIYFIEKGVLRYWTQINQEIDLLGLSGEEKYEKILKQNKELIENIPLKYLASYIALTPQRLSHLR